ncbi:MAG: TIGR04255 family protein [Caldilineaceae bacterium]|nr:TIGR04255 family protein [Caldilineaceae bacterium]
MEPVTEAAFHLQLQSGRAEFVPPRSRMRYKHAARQLLIQLADGILTVNMLPQYAGWRQLQHDIHQAWRWALEVLQPAGITRIGLRYIDFLPKRNLDEQAAEWLAANEYLPLNSDAMQKAAELWAMARKTVDNRVDIDYHMSCNRLPAQFPLRYLA